MMNGLFMKKIILSLLSVLIILGLYSCTSQEKPDAAGKPIVLVNIGPYIYFVEKIAANTVDIKQIIPTGANPHLFEPTLKDVEPFRYAKLWFLIGESFENKILRSLQGHNKNLLTVDLTENIDLLPLEEHSCCHDHSTDSLDRHIWLSAREAQKQVLTIKNALVTLFPENAPLYETNTSKLLTELQELDQEITLLLEPFKGTAIIVSHPAFGYFCRDYGLIQLSIEHEGKDPLPKHISSLLSSLENVQIPAIFTQPQYSNKGAEWIAAKLNVPTYLIDPYSQDYKTTLRTIAKSIASEKAHE